MWTECGWTGLLRDGWQWNTQWGQRGQVRRHIGFNNNNKKTLQQFCWTLLFDDGGSDHLVEGIVFAFTGCCNVHGGGANLLLLEAGLEQMRHLGLLKIINRQRWSVVRRLTALSAFLTRIVLIIHLEFITARNTRLNSAVEICVARQGEKSNSIFTCYWFTGTTPASTLQPVPVTEWYLSVSDDQLIFPWNQTVFPLERDHTM